MKNILLLLALTAAANSKLVKDQIFEIQALEHDLDNTISRVTNLDEQSSPDTDP